MSLRISDAVIWQETGDGISLYHTETGDFHSLNETASKIWEYVASEGEREKIIARLAEEFAGDNALVTVRIMRDVDEFVAGMVKEGLLEE
ncbi:MAG: PqqD family protein [Nonomuraea sp.]|nr:PqqD family protein [Nonomuraea sp.]NUP64907.1 PqqD family protein [Nonomuraea sp.]NUP80350.1 PqqD family protein [Nonomuraea sp.]NUS03364.1 PqqD family protein [Nonomuraea sp.]NUT11482.1 PqqD family protein [Nonomuraea sp.]